MLYIQFIRKLLELSIQIFFFCLIYMEPFEVTQSCPTLCDPMDCNLPDSSVHGILQERILEWVAISFSNKSFLKNWFVNLIEL